MLAVAGQSNAVVKLSFITYHLFLPDSYRIVTGPSVIANCTSMHLEVRIHIISVFWTEKLSVGNRGVD